MKTEKLKRCTDWFGVHSLRDLGDPSVQVTEERSCYFA